MTSTARGGVEAVTRIARVLVFVELNRAHRCSILDSLLCNFELRAALLSTHQKRHDPMRCLTTLLAAMSLTMTLPPALRSATLTPWTATEPEIYACSAEQARGYGPDRGLNFQHFEITITPLSKMPDSVALRERWPDKSATYDQNDVYFLQVGRNDPKTALIDDSYIGRAPELVMFISGPPDPMYNAIKFSGYVNTFIFHLDEKHAFTLFVYGAPYYEWVIDGHCQQER
jgi:hypothetical protein